MSRESANVMETPARVDSQEVEQKVRELIIEVHKLAVQPAELNEDMSQLDSVQTVELVVKLEETFGIVLDDAELNAENFKQVSNIVTVVLSKMEE